MLLFKSITFVKEFFDMERVKEYFKLNKISFVRKIENKDVMTFILTETYYKYTHHKMIELETGVFLTVMWRVLVDGKDQLNKLGATKEVLESIDEEKNEE